MKPGPLTAPGTAPPGISPGAARAVSRAAPPTLLLAARLLGDPDPGGVALTAAELRRAAAFRADGAARRYLAGRYAARRFVADVTGAALAAVAADYQCSECGGADGQSHGVPAYLVRGTPSGFGFSFSRSGQWLLAAAAPGGPVGVDLADTAGFLEAGLDQVIAAPAERRKLRALPPERRPAERARLWTRKEAVLKATGQGLRVAPQHIEVQGNVVSVPPAGVRLRVRSLAAGELGLPEGMLAALAVPGAGGVGIRIL